MSLSILGLGTALPPHVMTQEEALKMSTNIICQDERQRRLMRVLFRKAAVQKRHTAVPHPIAYKWLYEEQEQRKIRQTVEQPVGVPVGVEDLVEHCPATAVSRHVAVDGGLDWASSRVEIDGVNAVSGARIRVQDVQAALCVQYLGQGTSTS